MNNTPESPCNKPEMYPTAVVDIDETLLGKLNLDTRNLQIGFKQKTQIQNLKFYMTDMAKFQNLLTQNNLTWIEDGWIQVSQMLKFYLSREKKASESELSSKVYLWPSKVSAYTEGDYYLL